jgi:hypothetical protein
MRPGGLLRDVAEPLWDLIRPSRMYPLTYRGFGRQIGLSLREPDCLNQHIAKTFPPVPNPDTFAVGEVYSVRAGREGEGIVSTMVLITQGGHEVLWPGADA